MIKPKISIVIPVYNVADFIEDCLRSVAAQTYGGQIECLLIDDCGKDNSMELAKKFIAEYNGPIIWRTVRHLANGGQSAARNTGMKELSGDYVYFLDSDDEISPNCIEQLTSPLSEAPYDVVMGNYCANPSGSFPIVARPDTEVLHGMEMLSAYNRQRLYVMPWNKLYSMDYLRRNKLSFLEKVYLEDCMWSFQLYSTAESLRFVDQPTYIYRVREGSTMTAMEVKRKVGYMLTIAKEMVEFSHCHGIAQNMEVNTSFQGWIENLVGYVKTNSNNDLYKEVYNNLRATVPFKWGDAFKANGMNIKWQVRDIHWLMPSLMGRYMYLVLFYVYNYKNN